MWSTRSMRHICCAAKMWSVRSMRHICCATKMRSMRSTRCGNLIPPPLDPQCSVGRWPSEAQRGGLGLLGSPAARCQPRQ
eukprot:2470658-Alexandrium_andersonii.AAC.1